MTKKKEIQNKISLMSKSQKLYETKRALKKGFKSLEEYIESKLVKSEETQKLDRISQERSYWKKTKKVDATIDGVLHKKAVTVPFFDGNYWTQRNPNYKKGVSTDTSKEMMEHFLKWINHFELEDFKQGNDKEMFGTNFLFIVWGNLIGDGCNEEGIQKNLEKIFIEPFKWFNELEHLITKHSIFWGLIEEIWTYGSHFIDAEKVFSRYGRDKVPLAKRQFWLGYKSKVQLPSTGEAINIKGEGNKPWEVMLVEMKQNEHPVTMDGKEEKFLPIYRAFKVKKGKAIRKGVTKFSTDGVWNTAQDEGASWSYSSEIFNASVLGWNISTHHFKKYCGMNDNEASKHIVKKGFVQKDNFKHNPTFKDGYITALGLYLVKEEDILFITSARGENEVVINPSKANLIDYHIMDITDHIASKMCLTVIDSEGAKEQDFALTRGNIYNLSHYYELLRIVVKDYCQKEPTAVSKLLKNGYNSRNAKPFFEHFKTLFGFNLISEGAYAMYSLKSNDGLIYQIASLVMSNVKKEQEGKRVKRDEFDYFYAPRITANLKNAVRPKSLKKVSWINEKSSEVA